MTRALAGYPTNSLGQLIDIKHGYAFDGAHFVEDGPYSLLTPGNFAEEGGFRKRGVKQKHYDGPVPSDFILRPGDLLVAMTEQGEGLLGSSAYVPEGKPCLHNQRLGLVRARPDASVDLEFVYYLLNSRPVRQQIRASASGAKVRHTSPSRIYAVQVPTPAVSVQRRISSILSAYDDLIEVNRRRIAVLEEMARGLFEEWFIRFCVPADEEVPINETAEGRLPSGWSFVPLSEMARFTNGYAFKPSHFENAGTPVIKIPELKNGVSPKTPRTTLTIPSDLHIRSGDLLFSWSGTLAVEAWSDEPGLLNQHLFVVRPSGSYGCGMLKEVIQASMPKFDLQAVGATMKHIRRSALDHTRWAMPPDGPLLSYANTFLTSCYEQGMTLGQSNRKLAASRNLLLPRLVSGELSVAAAERELDAAA